MCSVRRERRGGGGGGWGGGGGEGGEVGGGGGGFFFFNDTATTEIYTLSLHDALPILVAYFTFGKSGSDRPNFWLWHSMIDIAPKTFHGYFDL